MTIGEQSFSVIVNTTDRARSLANLLQSFDHQAYDNFEIVVVVGPTKDNTLQVLSAYGGRVRVAHCPVANLSKSRNIGLLAARGDIVAFIDDDAVPCRNWLRQLNKLFSDPQLDATGGKVYLVHPRSPELQFQIGSTSALAEQVDVRSTRLPMAEPAGAYYWSDRMMGTNMVYRRQALLDINGFDEYFEWVFDDVDVALRLTAAGKIVHPVKEAVVYHAPASSRNRTSFTFNVRWWLHTKAAVYLSIKHGRSSGESAQAIRTRCLKLLHGHWLFSSEMLNAGQLNAGQFLRMRANEITYAARGAIAGGLRKRTLIRDGLAETMRVQPPIQPFHDDGSQSVPAFDPIEGSAKTMSMPETPLRICLLSTNYPPDRPEGVGRHTHMLAKGLHELGHTVHVITKGLADRVVFFDGAFVHYVKNGLDRYPQYRALPGLFHMLNYSHSVHVKIKSLILNDGIQLVDTPIWQFDGLVTAVSRQLPVVVRVQTATRQIADLSNVRDPDARLIGAMEERLMRLSSALVLNSAASGESVRHAYGLDLAAQAQPAPVIPIGIVPVPESDTRPYEPRDSGAEQTILFVGRLEKRKGIADLFEAIPLVLARYPRAKFVIAGADNSVNDGFRTETGMTYQDYFLKKFGAHAARVEFLGPVTEERLQMLYQSCDLFVAPSLTESFGLIYVEAMNFAKPVIGCRSGGVPEVVEDGVTGKLVDPASPNQLAAAIIEFLGAPSQLREFGLAGRARMVEKFSHVTMARQYVELYRKLLMDSAGQREPI